MTGHWEGFVLFPEIDLSLEVHGEARGSASANLLGKGAPVTDTQTDVEKLRFGTPLYTLRSAAWYLDLPEQTLRRWAGHASAWQLVTAEKQVRRNEPVMPFIGLAEAFVVRAFRRETGRRLKAEYVLDVLHFLQDKIGISHALASENLYLHGRQVLYDYGKKGQKHRELVEVLTQNAVMEKVVEGELKRITYRGGWAGQLILPITSRPVAFSDPLIAYGEPMFLRGDARIVDVLDRFDGGDNPQDLSDDFDVPLADVLDIVRAASKRGRQAA